MQLKNLSLIGPVSKVAPKIVPTYAMQGEGVAQVLNDIWLEEPFSYLQTDIGLNSEVLLFKPDAGTMQLHKHSHDLGNHQITALLNHSTELFVMNALMKIILRLCQR